MTSKDKSFPEKFKNFFRSKPPSTTSIRSKVEEIYITDTLLKDIGKESTVTNRIRVLRDLYEMVGTRQLEQNAVEAIWIEIKDLMSPSMPTEVRQITLTFIMYLVRGQYDRLEINREIIFNFIEAHKINEDLLHRFSVLKELTESGKDVRGVEEKMASLMLDLMDPMLRTPQAGEFMDVFVKFIKFNAAYFDTPIADVVIEKSCMFACTTSSEDGVSSALCVLDAIVCYSILPSTSLDIVVHTLCKILIVPNYLAPTWKLMKNLIGTHLGHSCVYILCSILQDKTNTEDVNLIRGAIYFVTKSIWGPTRVPTLKHTPTTILPYFIRCLTGGDVLLATEISCSLQQLITANGVDLQPFTWELVLDLLQRLIQIKKDTEGDQINSYLTDNLNATMTLIEVLIENRKYDGDFPQFYAIIDDFSAWRGESSVIAFLKYKAKILTPSAARWITKLVQLLERYFKNENRSSIRVQMVEIIADIVDKYYNIYEEEFMDRLIMPFFGQIESDPDMAIRCKGVSFLIDVAKGCHKNFCQDLINVIAKVANKLFESTDTVHIIRETEMSDVQIAVHGLIEIFKVKMNFLPSSFALQAMSHLISFLKSHYDNPAICQQVGSIRLSIFECMLAIRCNSLKQLGIARPPEVTVITPYLICGHGEKILQSMSSSPMVSPTLFHFPVVTSTVMSFDEIFNCINTCLSKEKDWSVLFRVLSQLPALLQNPKIIISEPQIINTFSTTLCNLILKNPLFPETYRNLPEKITKVDFHACIFPVMAALVPYHKYMDSSLQRKVISCVEGGLVQGSELRGRIVILTVCTLEMQDAMYRALPDVLLHLSKKTPTNQIAIPVLEFLSTLIRIPKLYASFVEDQYMSIFAMTLPYTHLAKFGQYVVALAHHVIALWFIKCKINFKPGFVGYIIKYLRNNYSISTMDAESGSLNSLSSEEYLQRRRSSGFNEQAILKRSRERPMSGGSVTGGSVRNLSSIPPDTMKILHQELMETCYDLMGRYTFALHSSMPQRSSMAEMLLKDGENRTWVLGNHLITISTSGCAGRNTTDGLCGKCWAFCKQMQPLDNSAQTANWVEPGGCPPASQLNYRASALSNRRRHRSDIQRKSVSSPDWEPNPTPAQQSKDDLQLRGQIHGGGDAGSVEDIDFGVKDMSPHKDITKSLKSLKQNIWAEHIVRDAHSTVTNEVCACWCQGWAEVMVRRPTGNTSCLLKMQNRPNQLWLSNAVAFSDWSELQVDLMEAYAQSEEEGEDEEGSLISESQCEPNLAVIDQSLQSVNINQSAKAPPLPKMETSADSPFTPAAPILKRVSSNPEIEFQQREADVTWADDVRNPIGDPPKSPVKRHPDLSTADVKLRRRPSTKKVDEKCESIPEETASTEKSVSSSLHQRVVTQGRPLMQSGSHERARLATVDISGKKTMEIESQSPTTAYRERGYTLAVMSGKRLANTAANQSSASSQTVKKDDGRSGINPCFVFLQLFHNSYFGSSADKPILIPKTEGLERSIKNLDRIQPFETHKIGLLYVGCGQASKEKEIFANVSGSSRYMNLLAGLGHLIRLADVDPSKTFLGGLEVNGTDGKYAYVWHDDIMQVIFHVSTLMPTKDNDPNCNQKKMHIGNDYVAIVYNDSDEEYDINTIKGQFLYACVVIKPLDCEINLVRVITKSAEMKSLIDHGEAKIVSDKNLAALARQLALHANLASIIFQTSCSAGKEPYASNWLERLRQIKRLKLKAQQEIELQREQQQTGKTAVAADLGQEFDRFGRGFVDFTSFV